MPDEATPAIEQGTGTPVDQIPTDFKAYDHWRRTGELPKAEEEVSKKPPATALESAPSVGEPEAPVKTAPESEPDDSQETEESPPQRPSSRQRRIDRLTRENAELQKRLEALEQRAAPPASPSVETPAVPGRPDLKDFKTLEEYTEALTDWKLNQREAQKRADDEKRAVQTAAQALQDSWAAKDQAAAQAHPDYRELMDSTEIPVGPGVLAARQALLEEENGAEILYHLASHPAELKRIAALSPAKAILEIGKLAVSLAPSSSPENPQPKVSSAPKPPPPLPRGTTRTADNVYDDDTARDWKRWVKVREAQLKGK